MTEGSSNLYTTNAKQIGAHCTYLRKITQYKSWTLGPCWKNLF